MAAGVRSASRRIGFVGSLVVALGIGAALTGFAGPAHAEGPASAGSGTAGSGTASSASASHASASTARPGLRRAAATAAGPLAADRVEPRRAARPTPAITAFSDAATPTPGDSAPSAYGDIGKWMLKSNGQIADWGGTRRDGKKLLEAVNVIIVDPHSTTSAQAHRGLNNAMLRARFPAQPLHTVGFTGSIDGVSYGQKPTGPLQAYSDNFFLFRNNHGRFFGPAPTQTDAGFMWTGAFSTERIGFSGLLPGHVYVSSNAARDALVSALVSSGQASYGGVVPLENAYNTDTTTTGDHDGFAVVLVLTGSAPLPRREVAGGSTTQPAAAGDGRRAVCSATDVADDAVGAARPSNPLLTVSNGCRIHKT